MRESISPYGDHVRIICRPADHASCNLLVQTKIEDHWMTVTSFNDLLDADAIERADGLASSLATRYPTIGVAIPRPETA